MFLPNEIIIHILSFVDITTLRNCYASESNFLRELVKATILQNIKSLIFYCGSCTWDWDHSKEKNTIVRILEPDGSKLCHAKVNPQTKMHLFSRNNNGGGYADSTFDIVIQWNDECYGYSVGDILSECWVHRTNKFTIKNNKNNEIATVTYTFDGQDSYNTDELVCSSEFLMFILDSTLEVDLDMIQT